MMAELLNGRCFYEVDQRLGRGGMAQVFLGRQVSPAPFSRIVAVKKLHGALATDSRMVQMLLDEARIASRVRHPALVPVSDVVVEPEAVYLVMDFVLGEALSALLEKAQRSQRSLPPPVVSAVMGGVLRGLHAAHEARDAKGDPLGIIHRDVSPQNVLVGADGYARLLDFGVARARGRTQGTFMGEVKGKTCYMAPEYLRGHDVDRRADVFAAGVVCWEMLCGRRLFDGGDDRAVFKAVLEDEVAPPGRVNPELSESVDPVVMKALERSPEARFATALQFVQELEEALPPASPEAVAGWVRALARESLQARVQMIRELEARPLPSLDRADPTATTVVADLGATRRETTDPRMKKPTRDTLRIIRAPMAPKSKGTLAAAALGGALLALVLGQLLRPPAPKPPWPPPGYALSDAGLLVPSGAFAPPGPPAGQP